MFFVFVCDGIKSFKVNDEFFNFGKCVFFVVFKYFYNYFIVVNGFD